MRYLLIILVLFILLSGCKTLKNGELQEPSTNENTAWVYHHSYEQCGEVFYPTIDSAELFLEENKIKVLEIEEKNLGTCSACGCPSSLHFNAKLSSKDIKKAKSLGWKTWQ